MPVTRDSLILRISQGGDPVSWDEFVAIYRPFLHNVLRRRGIGDHDACDVVQDVFVTLLRTLPRFQYRAERGRFRGWLKTIVQNMAADRLRRRGCLREVAIPQDMQAGSTRPADDDWDRVYHAQIARSAMDEVRLRSTQTTWACFEGHVLNRRAAAEIAAELGLSCAAVYMNASRTLSRIRARCAAYEADLVRKGGAANRKNGASHDR